MSAAALILLNSGIVRAPLEKVDQGELDAVLFAETVIQFSEGWWGGNGGV